jgi:hypothetical protein
VSGALTTSTGSPLSTLSRILGGSGPTGVKGSSDVAATHKNMSWFWSRISGIEMNLVGVLTSLTGFTSSGKDLNVTAFHLTPVDPVCGRSFVASPAAMPSTRMFSSPHPRIMTPHLYANANSLVIWRLVDYDDLGEEYVVGR